MSDLTLEQMSTTYYDVLKEIGNIWAGNATTALASLLQSKVDMNVPQVMMLDFQDVGALLGGEEQELAAAYLGVEGDINGSILFLIKKETAMMIAQKLLGEYCGDDLGEMECSAVKEVSNIITGSYLNAIATLTGLTIYPSVPDLTVDMAGAILSVPAIEFGIMGDKILLIQSQLKNEIEMDGYFIMVPEPESYVKILTSLGIPV